MKQDIEKKERLRKWVLGKNGYHYVCFSKDGRLKKFYAHRLVAIHFIDNPKNKPFINHKNGIKTDNSLGNLEWATHSENMQHSYDELSRKASAHLYLNKGGKHFAAVKIKCDTLDIVFDSVIEASNAFGINRSNIWKVASNRQKHTHGLSFRYI